LAYESYSDEIEASQSKVGERVRWLGLRGLLQPIRLCGKGREGVWRHGRTRCGGGAVGLVFVFQEEFKQQDRLSLRSRVRMHPSHYTQHLHGPATKQSTRQHYICNRKRRVEGVEYGPGVRLGWA